MSEKDIDGDNNPYHAHAKLKIILDLWMGIFPLWSGILLGDLRRYESGEGKKTEPVVETRYTNCHVENYFGILKMDIPKRKKLRPAEFIRRQYSIVKGKLSEIETVKPSKKKTNRKEDKDDQEQWRPKVDKSKKKSVYFTPPNVFPKKAKRKLVFEVSPTKSKKRKTTDSTEAHDAKRKSELPEDTVSPTKKVPHKEKNHKKPLQQTFCSKEDIGNDKIVTKKMILTRNAPEWGGTGLYKDKCVSLCNTCPLDNLLFILFISLKETGTAKKLITEKTPIQKALQRILFYMETGDWFGARMRWVESFCMEEVKTTVDKDNENKVQIDIYGTESAIFSKAFDCVQSTKQTGICNKSDCSSVSFTRTSGQICLR